MPRHSKTTAHFAQPFGGMDMNIKSNSESKLAAKSGANAPTCNLAIGLFGRKTAKPSAPAPQSDQLTDQAA